jgi:dTDP-4-amino-4,6-dideoxygalactose transaminase
MTPTVQDSIPLTRFDVHDPELMDELLETVARVASTSGFTGGPEVEGFEHEFAEYCGTAHAVGVSSGTEALALGLRALGIGAGDEVVVPANSFIATAEAVSMAGATPRFADVDRDTQLVTARTIEAALTPKVRCVIPVHLFGRTVDLAPIERLVAERGLLMVEDACQAHGAWMGDRRAGSAGAFAAFSFYPAKNLGAWGDGGALTCHDAGLADRVRLLRSHGEQPRYHHRIIGTTARLDALQAAILRVKLRRLDGWNDARRKAGLALTAALENSGVVTPAPTATGQDHVFHQYVVRAHDRDALRRRLQAQGVASAIHYPIPIHVSEAYADGGPDPAPTATALAAEICSLPIHPWLDDEAIARIADAVAAAERGI